jgi:hypothetical protein
MATDAGYVYLGGTTKREKGHCIAVLNDLPLAAQGKDKDDAVREVLKALKAYLEANKRLGQLGLVATRLGFQGSNVEESFKNLLSALSDYPKASERSGRGAPPVKKIEWEGRAAASEQKFTIQLTV